MEESTKKGFIIILKGLIHKLNHGCCEKLTKDQYDRIIKSLTILAEIEKEIEYEHNNHRGDHNASWINLNKFRFFIFKRK